MKFAPLWWDDPIDFQSNLPAEKVDMVIVGGGITGLTAGIELLRAGYRVQIFESQAALSGASGRAFGSIAIGNTQNLEQLCFRYGKERGETIWLAASQTTNMLRDYITENKIACDYYHGGHIRLAFHSHQEAELIKDAKRWSALQPSANIKLISNQELATYWPGQSAKLGLLDEASFTINPYKYAAELLKLFCTLKGGFTDHCAVLKIRQCKEGVRVLHEKGETTSTNILLATNGYTGGLNTWCQRRIFKVGSYMVASSPLSDRQRELFGNTFRTFTTAFRLKHYCRLTQCGRFIFGGRSNLSANIPLRIVLRELKESINYYFPEIQFNFTHVWGGNLGFTFDRLPHLGQNDSIFYAMGYCGRGLSMATLFGRAIASKILNKKNNAASFEKLSFPSCFLYKRKAWFLPIISTIYRWKDNKVV